MARKSISQQTIKRLFALSGNQCAFPSCVQPVIDDDGNVVAQVCHIEAANPGGERHNASQTDEERAAFENLLLLCNPHHVATNDVVKYSVAALRVMKAEHEAKFATRPAEATDEIANKLLASYEQIAVNLGSGVQNVVQNVVQNGTIVYQGLQYSDVRTMVQDLFDQSFPKLLAAAQQQACKNAEAFAVNLSDEVAGRAVTAEQVEKLAEPDTQFVLQQATVAGARVRDAGARKLLAGLVAERLRREDSLATIAFGEAVTVVPKLTSNQLRILAMVLFVTETRFVLSTPNWASFNNALEPWGNLLPVPCERRDVSHLASTSAATTDMGEFDIKRMWGDAYPSLFGGASDTDIRQASRLAAAFIDAYVPPLNQVKITPTGTAIAIVYLQQLGLRVDPAAWFK